MTEWQRKRLRAWLREFRPVEFHHGDCVGADAQAHKLVRDTLPGCRIIGHPCNIAKMRAHCKCDELREVLPPLVRNANIIRETDELIAAPETDEEQLRSGTWSTIRRAADFQKRAEVIEREQPK